MAINALPAMQVQTPDIAGEFARGQTNALNRQRGMQQIDAAELDKTLNHIKIGRQELAGAVDEPSYQRVRQRLARMGIPTDDMPPNFDPAYRDSEMQALLSAEQRLDMQKRQLFQQGNRLLAASPHTGQVNVIYEGPQEAPAAPKPVEPRLSELVDPKNPMRSLRVNLNEYQGGSVGDPGVYGVASIREPKSATTKSPPLPPDEQARLKAKGTAQAKFELAAPQAMADAQSAIDLIDMMVGKEGVQGAQGTAPHEGFGEAVGVGFGTRFIPGSAAASFDAMFKQIQGGAFLQAYESLRGGGAITEVEGQKATAARTRMSLSQSEEEFIKAAREYQAILRTGVERMKAKLAGTAAPTPAPAATAPAGGQRVTAGGTPYTIED